ncbi:acetyl-CoA hydrolase/transferase C-terminal domain-containing protein [Pseudomonas sp. RIT-PI-AD]|uniref:acetyl-CoA hydrolase/transferase family protein n=1 Tax=Pseudomonas sp. RIT-PI-AD TaxID=3035294 RepID=UPI0021D9049F|nr:acetyl-CoA hydrolase/transferase C-terminal domain-containing protein [Pseudomonas sp. RIT-PI-AD]
MPTILDAAAPDLSGLVRPGDTLMWGQANAEPLPLTQALVAQRQRLGRFRVMLGIAHADTFRPEHADHIDFIGYCGAGANRELTRAGLLDILPCHYSQLPALILSGALRIDVLLLQLSPADAQGRHSLALAHEYLLPALDSARVIIGEVNRQAPWVHGERTLRSDELDAVLYSDRPLLENPASPARPHDLDIARHIAGLVEDGATLQMGIGAIPDAVLGALADRRDLGVHSGSLGDGVAKLMQSGAINNRRKSIDRGLSVGGVLLGSRLLHDFAHDNPAFSLRSTAYTHDAGVLASLDRLVAINSAIEVDLTGQANSEVAAGRYLGAVGGLLDFLRGAHASRGGLPILALPSRAGASDRIVARLSGPVSVPRSDAGLVVTEHGVADLRGLSLQQRVRKMLDIAHPDSRARLEEDFYASR